MTSRNLFTTGRVLMAIIFIAAGIRKLLTYSATLGYFASLGIPLPDIVLPLAILIELGGATALVIGWRTPWVAGLLGAFCIASALLAHRFWAVDGPQSANQLIHFLKNVAMLGGFLVLAAMAQERRSE